MVFCWFQGTAPFFCSDKEFPREIPLNRSTPITEMDLPPPKLEKRKKKDKVEYTPLPMYRNSICRTGYIKVDCPTKIQLEWRKHDGLNKATHTANKGSPIITDEGKIIIAGKKKNPF